MSKHIMERAIEGEVLFVKRVSNVTVRKRLAIALIVGVVIFSVIDIRLGYVQFFMGDMLTDLGEGFLEQ